MSEKFEHKKLNEQRSTPRVLPTASPKVRGDYCEFMLLENNDPEEYIFCTQSAVRFSPSLGQIAGPNQVHISHNYQTANKLHI